MAISFVNASGGTYNGVATTAVSATTPAGMIVGDVMIAVHGNVGTQGTSSPCTPASGWVTVDEVLVNTNCYAVVLAKTATAADVTNAGTNQSLLTLDNSTSGTTRSSSRIVAYRGALPVTGNLTVSNLNHVTSPVGGTKTISSGSATNASGENWYVCAWNAANALSTLGSWTSDAAVDRGASGVAASSLTSICSIWDSGAPIESGSQSYSGTWTQTPSRLNGWVGFLRPAPTPVGVFTQQAIVRASRW